MSVSGWKAMFPRGAVILHDLVMVWVTWQLLHLLRYRFLPDSPELPLFSWTMLQVLVLQGAVFWWCGLYRGLWRFASLADLGNILRAVITGTVGVVFMLAWSRFEGIPLSVLALYPLVLGVLLGAPRLLYRAWCDHRQQRRVWGGERVLVLGAGATAAALLPQLRRMGRYEPIGLLDDAPRLKGARLQGIPVLGTLDQLPRVARESAATLLVIAIPSLDREGFQRVINLCAATHLPYRIAPGVDDILAGKPSVLKEVAIEDLLGRQPVEPDWEAIRRWLRGRTVLVTGAGGSIGSELCRQCARQGAARLVLVEHAELSLLRIEQELRTSYPDVAVRVVLGDCGDRAVMDHALSGQDVDAVFHAAAYKHVPVLEGQVREAVRNNVLASWTVAEATIAHRVPGFVLISTDKAVNPVNALGASKRLAEMLCQALGEGQEATRFVTVRFGNVLDSAGSVVPVFREQIARGGPVTLTHPEVTRYFMTIPESCQLILQAVATPGKGQTAVYTLDMGEPVSIARLAEQMIRLAGKVPGTDIAIVHTGLRPGEKLHETLFYADERHVPTAHPKVMQASLRPVAREGLMRGLRLMAEACQRYDTVALQHLLGMLVPDYGASHGGTQEERKVVPFAARSRGGEGQNAG